MSKPVWAKYYPLLTESQKKKYIDIANEHSNAFDKHSEEQTRFTILVQRLKETEKYKQAEAFFNEKVYCLRYGSKEHNEQLDIYRVMSKDAEESVVGFVSGREVLDNLNSKRWELDRKIQKFRSAVYTLYDLPEPSGVPTDDPERQCPICCINIKDHAITCGHVFCIDCIRKMKCECPNCKKSFVKDKVIKLYL